MIQHRGRAALGMARAGDDVGEILQAACVHRYFDLYLDLSALPAPQLDNGGGEERRPTLRTVQLQVEGIGKLTGVGEGVGKDMDGARIEVDEVVGFEEEARHTHVLVGTDIDAVPHRDGPGVAVKVHVQRRRRITGIPRR